MSVLVDLSIFPLDKGDSLSAHVARVLKIIRDSGLAYKTGPMGTSVEGEWDEVMGLVNNCFQELKKDCDRVYVALKMDYRKGPSGRIESKVRSVQEKL
ncbi:MAG: MTH1187 family thiamine-binding protein [Desulfobacteraceae bacterium]|jgi:uncharacterized protein (TIGR00106 family)